MILKFSWLIERDFNYQQLIYSSQAGPVIFVKKFNGNYAN